MSPRAEHRLVRVRVRRLTLPTIAALGLVLVVVAAMFAMLLLTTRSLDATSRSDRRATQMQQDALQLERTSIDLETGVRGYLITRDPSYLQPYESGPRAMRAHSHRLLTLSEPDQRPQVLPTRDSLAACVNDYTEPLAHSTRPGDAALL